MWWIINQFCKLRIDSVDVQGLFENRKKKPIKMTSKQTEFTTKQTYRSEKKVLKESLAFCKQKKRWLI